MTGKSGHIRKKATVRGRSSTWLVELLAPMKRLIPARSLTAKVGDWLATSQAPRILHIFERSCNLLNERGEILSIVTPRIGNGPFNLVLAQEVSFLDHLSLESRIGVSPGQLSLGDILISTADAELWDPLPDWERLYCRRDEVAAQLKQSWISNGSFSDLVLPFANADIPSARELAARLAGLGVGLTPSGDDFLMGAMYGIRILHPTVVALPLVRAITNTAAPLTTSLSAAWLRAAARGEAGERWHAFFNALLTANSSNVQLQVVRLLSVGHTSGADALSGFLRTLAVVQQGLCTSPS